MIPQFVRQPDIETQGEENDEEKPPDEPTVETEIDGFFDDRTAVQIVAWDVEHCTAATPVAVDQALRRLRLLNDFSPAGHVGGINLWRPSPASLERIALALEAQEMSVVHQALEKSICTDGVPLLRHFRGDGPTEECEQLAKSLRVLLGFVEDNRELTSPQRPHYRAQRDGIWQHVI